MRDADRRRGGEGSVRDRADLPRAERIVVKVGSSSLTTAAGGLDPQRLGALVDALVAWRSREGLVPGQVVLVSSGAIAAGLAPLGLTRRPGDLATQQAAASVGQGQLVARYARAFAAHDLQVGQVLLTADDVVRRQHYRNAQRTLDRLLQLGVVPVVNENDTVATHEIRLGDNDRLAALVAHLVHADALVLLSDVDALYDGEELYLGGVMEHIEEAGIHSGDSGCALPPATLGLAEVARVREQTEAIARGVGVRGLLNIQFALAAGVLYVLEANPRASRTVPFVSKATGVQLAKACARVMLGSSIAELRAEGLLPRSGDGGTLPAEAPVSVKEAVLPFKRFLTPGGQVVDSVLGPEMRSTGEVMGIDVDFPRAFAKSQQAAYGGLPGTGTVFVSVSDRDKRAMLFPVKRLVDLGFDVLATEGTAATLRRNGIPSRVVRKHSAGPGEDGEPTIVQRILAGEVDVVVNTPSGRSARADGYEIRAATTAMDRPIVTTVQQLAAAVQGIEATTGQGLPPVTSLQDHARALHAGWGFADAAGAGEAP